MIIKLVKRALAELRSAFDRTRHPDTLNNRAVREDRPHDMGILEDRVFFSATPLAAAAESMNHEPQESAAGGDWLVDLDFSDDADAQAFTPQSGSWAILNERFQAESDADAISLLSLSDPLSSNLELTTTVNVDDASPGRLSNGFTIFDYQSPTDFKFAGGYAGNDRWVIGHRTSGGWVTDVFTQSPIDALTDYDLRLAIAGDSQVTLYVDGQPQVTHDYSESLTDGQIGLGARDATTRFDDVRLRTLTADVGATPGDLPLFEDFDDLLADHLQPEQGEWVFVDGAYKVSPDLGQAGISTVSLSQPLPDDVEIGVSFNADEFSPSRFSNGFIVFDYQGPDDFKYAGGFLFRDVWVIGERTAQGWNDQVVVSAPLDASTDYDIRVVVENGSDVLLYQGDMLIASHSYNESVTDGALGLGSDNSVTRFDDFSVIDNSPVSTINAELSEGDLLVTGEALGELQIVAIRNDAFQIFDNGQLLFTVEDVMGDLRVELGQANDQLVIDLGGQGSERNVTVNLGDGDNRFEIKNGALYGSLDFASGEGKDSVTIADDVCVKRHTSLLTGSGDDSLRIAGAFRRMLSIQASDGDDSIILSGRMKAVSADAGAGDDSVELRPPGKIEQFGVVNLGTGDDTFVDFTDDNQVIVIDDYRIDIRSSESSQPVLTREHSSPIRRFVDTRFARRR